MWLYNSVFYQIYPFGFCNAPFINDEIVTPRIKHVLDYVEHFKKIGINAVYFSPIFSSDRHGYDTRDYLRLDERLGYNDDFKEVCQVLHENNIKVVLDGVFNHVGRGFWAFEDVLIHRENSRYKDWFLIHFDGNSNYNDGFYYEGWEGHYELVKLNLNNEEVVNYLLNCIRCWVEWFDIDGLRLDVAYSLPEHFMKRLRSYTSTLKNDFALIGEVLHGDYNRIVNDEMLHSCTNYECYKGLYSSFNEKNMFEISYSLNRQFGLDPWTLYKGKHLLCFVDNHDVTRVASILKDKKHLPLIYGLLFSMPGIPCIYYGSEWGIEGEKKKNSDDDLRPYIDQPVYNELCEWICRLSKIHQESSALIDGGYRNVIVTNKQLVFERKSDAETILVAINLDQESYTIHQSLGNEAFDLISQEKVNLNAPIELKPYSCAYWKVQ